MRALLAVLILGAAALVANADGDGENFVFEDWPGPPLTVHHVEPESAAATSPVVIVMHGMGRNADEYRDAWRDAAQRHGLTVYAPEFDRRRFPGSQGYNLGGSAAPEASPFAAIEPLFDAIRARRGAQAPDRYVLFGHSAGSQFVHRYLLLRPAPRLDLAIAANAGWYTTPDASVAWPYGLAGRGDAARARLPAALQRPMIVLLGTADTDPAHASLRRTPEAMAQGPHRYARGLHFLERAGAAADAAGVPLGWRLETVPGVDHDFRRMSAAAAELVVRTIHQKER